MYLFLGPQSVIPRALGSEATRQIGPDLTPKLLNLGIRICFKQYPRIFKGINLLGIMPAAYKVAYKRPPSKVLLTC